MPEAFEESYAEQTIQHWNTALRIGFLLVLDQTDHGGQTLHLSDSVRPMKLTQRMNPSRDTLLRAGFPAIQAENVISSMPANHLNNEVDASNGQ